MLTITAALWTFAQRWILGTGPSDGVEVVA